MPSIQTRQAVLTDLETLAPLFDAYRQFYGRPSDIQAAREFLRARFDHGESTLFIALIDDAPAGFAQLYPGYSSVALARTHTLNDLFVLEHARRHGIASALMSAIVQFAKTTGAWRLTLSTAISNETAQSLYSSLGWQRDERFLVYHLALST